MDRLPGQWAFEPKVNGWRGLVHVPTMRVWNRHGEPLTITDEFQPALESLWNAAPECMEWLDCEMLGRRHAVDKGVIIVLDWVVEKIIYRHRHMFMANSLAGPLAGLELVRPIDNLDCQPCLPNEPFKLWESLKEENHRIGCDYYEGIVAKRVDSPYEIQLVSPSKPTPHWIKWRFDQYTTQETP